MSKKNRWPCLFKRCDGPNLPHLCLYSGSNRARHFIGSRHTLLQLERRVFKVTLEKNLIDRKTRMCGTMHASSFIFFCVQIPQFKGDKLYTKIMPKKLHIYIGHRAHSRANHNPSFLPGPLIEKHYRILGMRARLPDYVIFMRSKGCAVQYWGITLTAPIIKNGTNWVISRKRNS